MFFNEIKNMQLECSLSMLSNFIKKFKDKKKIRLFSQNGKSSYYKRRSKDSSIRF